MQSPPFPRYLVPPRSRYSPQHHILKHPQLPFFPQCQRPSFTPIQRIVLSPEEASCLQVFLNMNVLQGRVVSTSPNPQAGGPNYCLTDEIILADRNTSLTPCNTVLIEEPMVPQLAKKFHAFYSNRIFITEFTRARHLSPS